MSTLDTAMTVAEASALLDLDEKAIRKELEHGIVGNRKREPVEVTFSELVYIAVTMSLGLHLGVEDRRTLHDLVIDSLEHTPRVSRVKLSPILDLHLGAVFDDVASRFSRFEEWKSKRVVEDPQILAGEPTFRGTRVPVRKIGEMLREHGKRAAVEIAEDYPSLTKDDLEFALRYVRAYPRRGRPRETAAR